MAVHIETTYPRNINNMFKAKKTTRTWQDIQRIPLFNDKTQNNANDWYFSTDDDNMTMYVQII